MTVLTSKHGEGYLFAGRTGSKSETMKSPAIMHAVTRWLAKEGVTVAPFQTRDLRRTWKSRAADAGVDRFIRDLIQQHAQGDIGSVHYDRADYAGQMRAGMDKWDLWLRRNVTAASQLGVLRVV